MHPVGRLIDFVGGTIGRMAGGGFAVGTFMVVMGLPPGEYVRILIIDPPAFLDSVWTRTGLVILGLVVIWASIRFNVWSQKQRAIDALAEDLSWAIGNLLNRDPRPNTDEEIDALFQEFLAWCNRVSAKLENRAFFTRADQLHFDRLGFVDPVRMTERPKLNWILGMLRLKFTRLRDVINWTQLRTR